MNISKYYKLLIITGLAFLSKSCTSESFKEIESDLLGQPNYSIGVYTATVSVTNIKQKAVQTNGLGGYLLGQYTQNPFGTKKANIVAQVNLSSVSPVFGADSQSAENTNNSQENETVVEAYLHIPFFNENSSVQTPTYTADTEYRLDSIYGNKNATFNVNVKELNYFLSEINQNAEKQIFYSDLNIENHLGSSLATNTLSISNKAITRYKFDNPDTTEDESKETNDVLSPGIRIALDKTFFQNKIIDKEGANELSNNTLFKNYFRGIHISASNFSQNLMMLLNLSKAKIELVYTYEKTTDGNRKTLKNRYEMNLGGIMINLFENSGESLNAENGNNVQRVFLGGGQRNAEFNLFTNAELTEIRSKKVLVTDATLMLHLDESVSYAQKPERIFIYNAKTGGVLADYTLDPTNSATLSQNSQLVHLAKLNKNYYHIRLTNHVANVIKGTTENVPLGIAVASNVKGISVVKYSDSANYIKNIPSNTVTNPLSAVIYGNNQSVEVGKRLQLKISYIKPN